MRRRSLLLILLLGAGVLAAGASAAAPSTKRLRIDAVDAGTVTVRPGGVVCTATCETRVRAGGRVTLVASPDPGHRLVGWGGACRGQRGLRCVLVVEHPKYVFATFAREGQDPPPPP